jgi:hypothetical protein
MDFPDVGQSSLTPESRSPGQLLPVDFSGVGKPSLTSESRPLGQLLPVDFSGVGQLSLNPAPWPVIDLLNLHPRPRPPPPPIDFEKLDSFLYENPIGLFSECVASICPLNRCTDRFQVRRIFEVSQFYANLVLRKATTCPTYTSFGSGSYFQDIVNLCYLIKTGHHHFNLNFIDDCGEYIECLADPHKNPLAMESLVGLDIHDENLHREQRCQMNTYRLIKLLELFEDYTDHLTLFRSPRDYVIRIPPPKVI